MNYKEDNMATPEELIILPRQEEWESRNLGWIHKVGGKKFYNIQGTIKSIEELEKDFNLADNLIKLLCVQHETPLWEKELFLEYQLDLFLVPEGGKQTFNEKTRIEILTKFLAHLISFYIDIKIIIPETDKKFYIEKGLLDEKARATSHLRQRHCLAAEEAQKQVEGMPSKDALKLFYNVLNKICKDVQHRSHAAAHKLLPILAKTIYLSEIASENIVDRSKSLALFLLNAQGEKILVRSGYYGHTFYVGIEKRTALDSMEIYFVINNFNTTAAERNIQRTRGENDFSPYVIKLTTSKFSQDSKKNKHKKFEDNSEEVLELAFYLSIIQRSTAESRVFVADLKEKKLTEKQKKKIDKIKETLKPQKEKILAHIRTANIYQNGFFCLTTFQTYIKSNTFNNYVGQLVPSWNEVRNTEILLCYLLQQIQTLVCSDIIYCPWKYNLRFLTRDQESENKRPSSIIQRIGNCTIHNLKIGLYSLAGFDWREQEQLELITNLNIDISLMTISLIKTAEPGIVENLPVANTIPMPLPSTIAVTEIREAHILLESQKLQEAKDIMVAACKKYKDDGYAFFELGLIFDRLLEIDKAIKCYLNALESITSSEIHTNIGICYAEKNDYQKAFEHFNLALHLNPYDRNAYFNRVTAFCNIESYSKALEDIEALLRLDPQNPEYHLLKGKLLCVISKFSEAWPYLAFAQKNCIKDADFFLTMFGYYFNTFKNSHEAAQRGEPYSYQFLRHTYQMMDRNYKKILSYGDEETNISLYSHLQMCKNVLAKIATEVKESSPEFLLFMARDSLIRNRHHNSQNQRDYDLQFGLQKLPSFKSK
jgi:tetratricopeptide (TPR) repeat protein